MKNKGAVYKLLVLLGLFTMLMGCNNEEAKQEMKQEQQEDIIDEREDRQLDSPVKEYRQEQMEDRMDEREDDQ
ncbi:hypothetical protein ACFO9Q_21650 [Paenibacillus sp. GCM10023252]|uniref:hypothetical protein n=1 Tax=Paenibacillus sp. GCM10023252 TaxID=3252649 RepID=UPI003611B350